MTFEKISYRPAEGARTKTIFLQDVRETTVLGHPAITGVEVAADGDEISGKGFDERTHIIQAALVVRRTPMVMDNTYGLLVEA